MIGDGFDPWEAMVTRTGFRIAATLAVTLALTLAATSTMSVTAVAKEAVPILRPVGEPYDVTKGLRGKRKDGEDKKARDVSGIACLPAAAGPRRCLIVDDEATGAQFVTIEGRVITPGPFIDLIGEAPSPSTLGMPPPRHDCPNGSGGFGDLDGEAVAYAAPYFYVVGSHGCSRRGKEFKLSTFLLARIRVGEDGAPVGSASEAVETTYRLSDALAAADMVGAHFAQDLQTNTHSNGLNAEGLAIVGGKLFLGLRAPSLDGVAYIVAVPVESVFAPGRDRLKAKPALIPIAIGKHTGIRDLAVLPDGRLLALTGPAQEQGGPYGLVAVEPTDGAIEHIGRLADLVGDEKGGKAEAVALLGPDRVLVLFDGLKNGAPREYKLP